LTIFIYLDKDNRNF